MSKHGRRARATLALDGVHAAGRNRDRGGAIALDALREMVGEADEAPSSGLSLFAGVPSDPVAELISAYDEAIEDYGTAAAHGAVELLARVAAAAVKELAELRRQDPDRVVLRIVRQFGSVEIGDE